MVTHQNIRMNPKARSFANLFQCSQKRLSVLVIKNTICAAITTRHHMIYRPSILTPPTHLEELCRQMERERNEAARLVRRLLRSHGEKTSLRSVSARSDAGLWLARYDSENARDDLSLLASGVTPAREAEAGGMT